MIFPNSLRAESKMSYINLTPQEFHKQYSENKTNALLLDVRTEGEYNSAHIANSLLIPVQVLADQLKKIEKYKNKPVYIYCRSGNRSVTAANILLDAGFTKVYQLPGGIGAWARAGLPIKTGGAEE